MGSLRRWRTAVTYGQIPGNFQEPNSSCSGDRSGDAYAYVPHVRRGGVTDVYPNWTEMRAAGLDAPGSRGMWRLPPLRRAIECGRALVEGGSASLGRVPGSDGAT